MVVLPSARHLRHLIALAEHGHFGQAAACHVNQSTLSASINELENALEAALVAPPSQWGQTHADALLARAIAFDDCDVGIADLLPDLGRNTSGFKPQRTSSLNTGTGITSMKVGGAERAVRIAQAAPNPAAHQAAETRPGGSASEIKDQDDERSVCRPKHFNEGHFFTSSQR